MTTLPCLTLFRIAHSIRIQINNAIIKTDAYNHLLFGTAGIIPINLFPWKNTWLIRL